MGDVMSTRWRSRFSSRHRTRTTPYLYKSWSKSYPTRTTEVQVPSQKTKTSYRSAQFIHGFPWSPLSSMGYPYSRGRYAWAPPPTAPPPRAPTRSHIDYEQRITQDPERNYG